MSNKLKNVQYWPDECFIGNPEAKFLKYKNRMNYIDTYLKSILKCKQYFNIPQWKEIFKYDIAFSSIQNSKDRNSDDSNSSNFTKILIVKRRFCISKFDFLKN